MVDSRQKGQAAERAVAKMFSSHYGAEFKRVPQSGALDPSHKLKGDIYCPDKPIKYCIEVKSYETDHFNSKIYVNKSSKFLSWLQQAEREALQMHKTPLLIYKYNRSPFFVCEGFSDAKECCEKISQYNAGAVLYFPKYELDWTYLSTDLDSFLKSSTSIFEE